MEFTWGIVGFLTPIQMIASHDFGPGGAVSTANATDADDSKSASSDSSKGESSASNLSLVFSALMFSVFLGLGLGGMACYLFRRVRDQYFTVLRTRDRRKQMATEVRTSLFTNVLSVQLLILLTQVVELIGVAYSSPTHWW